MGDMAVADENKRVTSTMRPTDLNNLETIVRVAGVKEGQAVRQALATERFVQEELARGATLWVRQPDGTMKEIVVLR
jgi:hypothetical protein